MPVPATTGSYKTSIHDMDIGDYAAMKYVASSGQVGTFMLLLQIANSEHVELFGTKEIT